MMLAYNQLWGKLCEGDETVLLEAKTASDVGKSILETISAFSNEPDMGGGYFLLGVARKARSLFPDYEVVGVPDVDKIQCDMATQCRDLFNFPIRPDFSVENIDGKKVVVAFIPEAPANQKPIYIQSKGSLKGAYRRVGPTDHLCTEDDLSMFFQSRGQKSFDETVVDGTTLADIDPQALSVYRNARETDDGAGDLLRLSDIELLYALNATSANRPDAQLTLGGLVLFGRPSALRRHMPMTRVDYIRVDGIEWVKNTDHRYQTIEKLGPLLVIIPQLVNLVLDDIPKAAWFERICR